MLIGQASINLSANILSALLGLLSVFIFTRLFSPHDYGVYLLGLAFATVVSVFLAGWFRNLILSGHARNDGTEVRGVVATGYMVCCFAAPVAYGLGLLVGLDATTALAAVALAVAIGLFELTQDLVGARLMAITAMKGTLVRAAAALGLGVGAAMFGRDGILLLVSSAFAYLLAVLVQRVGLARHGVQIRPASRARRRKTGSAADAVADPARDLHGRRPLHYRQSGRHRRCRQIYRGSRPRPADADDAGDQRRRRLLPARRADPCQPGRRRGAIASRRMPRIAAEHHAAGLPRLRPDRPPCRQCGARRRFPQPGRRDHADRGGRRRVPDPHPAIFARQFPAVGTQLASI